MLCAKRKLTGEIVTAYFANKSQAPFSCPECSDPVILKSGKSRVNYFAHENPLACRYAENESDNHRRCKMEIFLALQKEPHVRNVALERPIGTNRADVSAEINGVPVAIEVQLSSLSPETIAYRTMEYARKGIYVLWLLQWTPKLDAKRYTPRLKMRDHGVMLSDVMDAVKQSNLNVGGKIIEENGMEFVVRGIGLVNSINDLENIVVSQNNGMPIYLTDVATVQLGGDFRRGALDVDGHEVVGGVVVMRNGENAMAVIKAVKEKIAQLSSGLPPGISIKPFYDRSDLISRTIDTLKHALTEEAILVTLVIIIFLFHFRSILIVMLPLPLSILVSFILMNHFGISSNIMSLSGIAIAIGVLVDAGIVMVENVIRQAERAEREKGSQLNSAEIFEVTLAAAKQVGRPIIFAVVIIILAFVPVFALSGQEGKLFHPLAFTKTFAMIGAAILAVTLVPVLCAALVRGPFQAEHENWLMRGLLAIYDPVLSWALRFRKTVLALAGISLIAAMVLALGLPRPIVFQISKVNPELAE